MLTDDAHAFSATKYDYHGQLKVDGTKPAGPQTILYDTWRSQGWDLLSHGGFVTYPHHDASGLCTYVFVRSGAKLWGFFHPKVNGSREERFGVYDSILHPTAMRWMDEPTLGYLLLERGALM